MDAESNNLKSMDTVSQRLHYQWGHHPALGGNFLEEDCEIYIKGTPKVSVNKK